MRRKHDRRRRFLFKLGLAAGFVVVLWIIGLIRFADMVPAAVVDATTRTDAVIVLTGGSRRLGEGLELLSRGLAEKLFVSGVYQGVEVRELLKVMKRRPGGLESLIGIGNATNTAGNAIETTVWMKKNEYRSLRLVTAAYHMPRSLLEFGHAMPGVTLIPHPVFPENVKRDRWWAWPGTASLMIGEYDKNLLAWSRHWIRSLFEIAGMGAGTVKEAAKAGI